jgi:hypothetical protein
MSGGNGIDVLIGGEGNDISRAVRLLIPSCFNGNFGMDDHGLQGWKHRQNQRDDAQFATLLLFRLLPRRLAPV